VTTVQNFPNPPYTVTNNVLGDLTVSLNYSGGPVSFDTGTQPLLYSGSSYSFNEVAALNIPVDISYSLTTDGQTYSGMNSDFFVKLLIQLGTQLNVSNYPASIVISPNAYGATNWFAAGVANFTAANGFQANIQVSNVPEPTSLAVFSAGFAAMLFVGMRKRRLLTAKK
jgi:hypothetical protein